MIPRRVLLDRLDRQVFDVLVIGGGIVGAGIARDAAMRGLSVALVEQGDFAGGTSSKTSKLIHGGLRYLEQGRLKLVAESIHERSILRTIAPDVVAPLSLLLPIYAGTSRPAWKVRAGLMLYDLLAAGRGVMRGELLGKVQASACEPALATDGLLGAGSYGDCQMDDARLCLLNILQSVSFGAVCLNYVRLRALIKARGHVQAGAVEDIFTGQAYEVRARVVVNACGPWSDHVRRLSDPAAQTRLAPTKGIHLIVPRLAAHGLFVEARRDKRPFFILPWGDHSLIGTTESPLDGPLEALRAEVSEVGYLLEEARRIAPGAALAEKDVIATFAGARPLLAFAGSSNAASREHVIEIDRFGLLSIMGGKYTTYRRMAAQTVDSVVRLLSRSVDRCLTDRVALREDAALMSLARWQAVTDTLAPETTARLISRYGIGCLWLFRLLEQDPSLSKPACVHHPYLAAELIYAIQEEFACTVTDVLARRTRMAWSPCHGLDVLPVLVGWFERYARVPHQRMAKQVDAYCSFLGRAKASHPTMGLSSTVGRYMEETLTPLV